MENKDMALPQAEWRTIPSHPQYLASSLGEIRRDAAAAAPLRGSIDRDGYRRVCVSGKTVRVHSLVCAAFHGPRPHGLECAHLDGDQTNNAPTNLKWVTHKENVGHSLAHGTFSALRGVRPMRDMRGASNPRASFSATQVEEIKSLRASGLSFRQLGKLFGCNASTVFKIVKGISYAQ